MTPESKHTWATIAVIGGVALVIWWLLSRSGSGSGASTAPLVVDNTAGTPGGIPASSYNLTFQSPALPSYGSLKGYVPLFGFIGYSGQTQ